MRMFTFKGGVYPPERKTHTRDGTVEDAFPSSKRVTIPVTMGGSPNECTVNVGDRVVKGQVIAASDKYMSVPVHASITGTVVQIAPHAAADGARRTLWQAARKFPVLRSNRMEAMRRRI